MKVLKSKSPLIQQQTQINRLWDTGGVRAHINRAPHERGCHGGHVVSRYLSSLQNGMIRKVVIDGRGYNRNTGLLTVLSYEYRSTNAPWPLVPNRVCPGSDDIVSTDIEYT